MKKEFERLKELRLKLGLTQEAMADALGVSKQYFSRVETAKTNLSKEKIVLLSNLYGVSTDWLLLGLGEVFLADKHENKSFLVSENLMDKMLTLSKINNFYTKLVIQIFEEEPYPLANLEDKQTVASILFGQDFDNKEVSNSFITSKMQELLEDEDAKTEFKRRAIATMKFMKTR